MSNLDTTPSWLRLITIETRTNRIKTYISELVKCEFFNRILIDGRFVVNENNSIGLFLDFDSKIFNTTLNILRIGYYYSIQPNWKNSVEEQELKRQLKILGHATDDICDDIIVIRSRSDKMKTLISTLVQCKSKYFDHIVNMVKNKTITKNKKGHPKVFLDFDSKVFRHLFMMMHNKFFIIPPSWSDDNVLKLVLKAQLEKISPRISAHGCGNTMMKELFNMFQATSIKDKLTSTENKIVIKCPVNRLTSRWLKIGCNCRMHVVICSNTINDSYKHAEYFWCCRNTPKYFWSTAIKNPPVMMDALYKDWIDNIIWKHPVEWKTRRQFLEYMDIARA